MIDKNAERALLKREKKSDLIDEILEQHDRIVELSVSLGRQHELAATLTRQLDYSKKAKLKDHCLSISFDPWPLMEWKRLGYSPYRKGKYAQLLVGPLRVDWFVG